MSRPDTSEFAPYYKRYIELLADDRSLVGHLEDSLQAFTELLYQLDAEKWNYRYAEDKWTIKEIVQHIIDTERVFAYRALRFARNDQTPLAGFDENRFALESEADKRGHETLVKEFILLRNANILMFAGFGEKVLDRKGWIGDNRMSVRAAGFICSGHVLHHLQVIRERYLSQLP